MNINDIGKASSVSEGYDIPLKRLTETSSSVTVVKYATAIQITDEAAIGGYGDPLGEGAMQCALAVDDAIDDALLAALAANSASEQNYATSGSSVALEPEDIPLALAKFGEDNEGEKLLYVTPDFYAKLVGKNWIPASEIADGVRVRGAVGMAYGCQVVISNRLVSGGSLYIMKPRTLGLFIKRGVMVETDRDILNQSTVVTASILAAPYLMNPKGMIKLSVGS